MIKTTGQFRTVAFDVIDSTQSYASTHLERLLSAHPYWVITAEEQHKGKGSHQRSWLSLRGNIFATYLFSLPKTRQHCLPFFPYMAGLAVKDLLCGSELGHLGLTPKFKWVNDIQLNRKKVAGVLCESREYQGEFAVMVGIGMNINLDANPMNRIDQPVSSLHLETGQCFVVAQLRDLLHRYFAGQLEMLLETGNVIKLIQAIDADLAYKGEAVTLTGVSYWQESEPAPDVVRGVVKGLDLKTGFLRLEVDGVEKQIMVGRAEHSQ